MIKSLVISTFLATAVFALSGQSIYDNKCASCHKMKGMMDMSQMKAMKEKMKTASNEEKEKMKAKIKKSGMKAPPMNMVSLRIKKVKAEGKAEFVAFVKDYIVNPSKDKGVCMPMAYKRFGTMPPIGKSMSEEEREVVASWMYDTFKGTWKGSKDARTCDSNNAASKKSSSKCGGTSKASKE